MSSLYSYIFIWCIYFGTSFAKSEKDLKAVFIQYAVECSQEYPISKEEFDMLKSHKFPDSKNAKCLQACAFKKIKWMDSHGMFDDKEAYNTSIKILPDQVQLDNARKLYDECLKVNQQTFSDGDSGCERAAILTKCLTEYSLKLGFVY